jgi:integrase
MSFNGTTSERLPLVSALVSSREQRPARKRTQKRGRKGEVHLFRPTRSDTFWVRYTVNGERHRRNTGKESEADARIFAAQVARAVGLANSDDLDEKRRLLEICRELMQDIPELEAAAAQLTATRHLPTTRAWFDRELGSMRQNRSGDDRQLKAATIARVAQVLNDFLAFLKAQPMNLSDEPLSRIAPDDIRGFLADYKAKGYSGSSRKFALARIRAGFGRAVDSGFLLINPASVKQVGRMKFDSDSIRQPFNPQQVAALLANAAQSSERWLYLSAMLGLFTGQRAGDICAMRWEDVKDCESSLSTIHVVQQKSGNAIAIPIAEPLRMVLQKIQKPERRGYLLGDKIAPAYLAGRHRNWIRGWRDLLNSVDLAGMLDMPVVAKVERSGKHGRTRYAWCFHSWRHTTATYLSGPDAHYLLGHRSADEKRLGITAQYRHPDLQRLKAQLDAIPLAAGEP